MSIFPPHAAGPASPSGVRRGGDYYQDLMVWSHAMQLIRARSGFCRLEVERTGVGNFDDVILRGTTRPDLLSQVKWSTTSGASIDETYLTAARANGRSLLQKLFASYLQLRGTNPDLQIITNRAPDPQHPLLGAIDGRTELLKLPAEVTRRSHVGKALQAWCRHVDGCEDDLRGLLGALRFVTGRSISSEIDRVCALMEAAGLQSDDNALLLATAEVQSWVREGRRVLTPEDVHASIDARQLRAGDERGVLLVQALDWDRHPEDAHEVLDWVDLFQGDNPKARCQPKTPDGWMIMQAQLTEAIARLEMEGWQYLTLRGMMRQATFFLVGALAPKTRSWKINYVQRRDRGAGQSWDTEAPIQLNSEPRVDVLALRQGEHLAVVLSSTLDATHDVCAYLQQTAVPANTLLSITPGNMPHDASIAGSGHAALYAQQVRQIIRQELTSNPAVDVIHLFLAGPGGLALLLGHRWNRLRPTIVYEHLGDGLGYTPAFSIN
ncbi:MAG: SAVED domain-containing protein [Kineosporiaceae bacterium]|nr:SAVED domain-containing protein [Kineosporiaceae bacterium]MBK8075415.1 SAVED domain-containing protein [Kineosporiaceae bacterium]